MLTETFNSVRRAFDKISTTNVNGKLARESVRNLSKLYYREGRPAVQSVDVDDEVSILDAAFETLLRLASGANATSSYKKQFGVIRRLLPKVATQIELSRSRANVRSDSSSDEDKRVITTLEGLVPSAAVSYRQAIADLADDTRISFRGPALELREALRETLDHLAPDGEVEGAPGYVRDKDRNGPTMKQKVRFILKARGRSKSASATPEQTANMVEESLGNLTRSVYDLSSVATHVDKERKAVMQVRRYIVAILHDILEL
jgi:Predicted pPIWI-associating nuclease